MSDLVFAKSIKVASSVSLAYVISLFGGFEEAVHAFLVLLVLDFVTGFLVGWRNKTLESYKMRRFKAGGLGKLLGYFIILISANQIDIIYYHHEIPHELLSFKFYALAYLSLSEGLSILENLSLLGVPVPEIFKKRLKVLQEKMHGKRED